MPFISIKMLSGRTDEQKRKLTKAVTDAMVDALGIDPDNIWLTIEEFEKDHWAKGGIMIADRK